MLRLTSSDKQLKMPTSTSKAGFLLGDPQLPGVGRYASWLADCMSERVQQASQGVLASTSFLSLAGSSRLPFSAPVAYPWRSRHIPEVFTLSFSSLATIWLFRSANLHLASVCFSADSA